MSISVNSLTSGRRAVKRQNNRDAILDAARDVFAEIGYGGTTVRDMLPVRSALASMAEGSVVQTVASGFSASAASGDRFFFRVRATNRVGKTTTVATDGVALDASPAS